MIKHFSYQQHELILYDDEIKINKLCEQCMKLIISTPFYTCVQCNFFIHTQCTKLPTKIKQHPLSDFYMLTLLPRAPIKSVCSFVIFVLVITVVSPTIVLNLACFRHSLTFNAVQFRKRLNTKVISFTFLYIQR
jgi:hypothetical protein